MENKNKITAEWARDKATTILGLKVSLEVEKCLETIETAVSANKMSTSVNMYANALTIKELEKRGFKVKQQDDQREGSYLTIEW